MCLQQKYISRNSKALLGYNIKNETKVSIKFRANSSKGLFYQTINIYINHGLIIDVY